jgi:acyl-CoA dehydrogenase
LVIDNFPNRYLRAVLRIVVFPFGRRERASGDRLTHKVAQLLLSPSDTRDRLTDGVYKSASAGHPVGMMEVALPQVIHAEPLERKLLKALKHNEITGITWDEQVQDAIAKSVITAEEADILVHVRNLVMDIIAVDEFDPQELRSGIQLPQKVDTQHAA